MRFLLCHNHYQQAGGEDQVYRDERWLLESHGHEVFSFVRHNDEIEHMSRPNVAMRTLWNDESYIEIRSLIRQQRPNILHCTNTFPLISPAVYYAARAENVPVVQSLHNYRLFCANGYLLRDGKPCEACIGKSFAWPAVTNCCYRNDRGASTVVAGMQALHRAIGTWRNTVNMYITCSQFAREKFLFAGLPAEKLIVKPNFVNPDAGIGSGDGGYAVFVGRLSPEKGVETVLAAWRRMSLPIRLKLVGDGPLAERVRTAAQQDSRIEWMGWQSIEDVLRIVGDASMLLMPSIWYEIFGRTIVESFSKGTPAIVSRLGAMAELVDDGRTGFHFTPGDASDLAQKVARLWQDENLRKVMRPACREEFEAKYTAAANYRQLMEIYARAQQAASQGKSASQEYRPARVGGFVPLRVASAVTWPRKLDVFGVEVTPTTYSEAVDTAIAAARHRQSSVIACHAAHAIVTASNDSELRAKVNRFDMVTPDGQPVRWALNMIHGAKLPQRVYGPELMLRLCEAAAREKIGIYLYGGTPDSLARLQKNLLQRLPDLAISGAESPPFRPLTPDEDSAVVDRIRDSGAGLVFIGLGCPKQDHFAADHRDQIQAVQVCVGAAFDFHAGIVPMAPAWMQKRGLEWLFRLCREPRRLWRRYLVTNTQFALKLGWAVGARFLADNTLPSDAELPFPAGPAHAQ
jgi:exopolysaccharide biosynthesis WecB/TagA/CpsF family protein